MSYLCDRLFLFTFIIINHMISLKQTNRHTCFLEYVMLILDGNVTWMKKANNFQIAKVQPQDVA